MEYIGKIIDRYKRIRNIGALEKTYKQQYALVGIGNHCVSNLLPVMQHLQLPLKYICCTSERKAALIHQKYKGVKGTTCLQEVLDDECVKGVFVATNPCSHFTIACKVIMAGKSLFIEKPPCQDIRELNALRDVVKLHASETIVVGLQRRFAPATHILQRRLAKECVHHYHYRYLTGLYPEGDALTDLFIHPLDYVVFLFGRAIVRAAHAARGKKGGHTIFLVLEHHDTMGMLELSTDYTWQQSRELLSISTDKGFYSLDCMESLDFSPRRSVLFGIPLEKVIHSNASVVKLYDRNGFVPTVVNNQIYSQGFFSEIEAFADMVESGRTDSQAYGVDSMTATYSLMEEIRESASNK